MRRRGSVTVAAPLASLVAAILLLLPAIVKR